MNQQALSIKPTKLQELMARLREEGKLSSLAQTISVPSIPSPDQSSQTTDRYGHAITYNSRQQEFIDLISRGSCAVLIGPAGTGKTTCMKGATQALIQSGIAGIYSNDGHKHIPDGSPGIVICAYTRRAVANIRKNMPEDLKGNCITIHKLLEYQPVYDEVIDPESGETRTKMSFQPTRTAANPLPSSIRCIIFEESSMIGTDLYQEVINALPHNPQQIFLGDIQQLPPVFGPAILGFKLLEYSVVELTEVYRQALESPIISLAHRILSGRELGGTEYPDWKSPGKLTIHPWKKRIAPEAALYTAGMFFTQASDTGVYDSEEDIILIPFNKSFGTDELNKIIANHLARKRGAETYQIIAGFNKHHFSIGDKVLYEKEDAQVVRIEKNISYSGAQAAPHSLTLDYWGHDPKSGDRSDVISGDEDIDFLLGQVSSLDKSDERVRQASHQITLRMLESEVEVTISKAAEINALALGYALTVHKSQGSEWRKVFFILHQSHATMVSRELLYTGVTRAREELYVICEPDTFEKGIKSQRVKGNTLEEKAQYFKGKLEVTS